MVNLLMPVKLKVVGQTHVGKVRQNNEDVWAQLPDERLYILADGMGGHQAGEIAAREAANYVCRQFRKELLQNPSLTDSPKCIAEFLRQAIKVTNMRVYQMGREADGLRGMGTTLCCLWIGADQAVIAHVGDSRIYRLKAKQLTQLTKDHSLLRELLDMGQLNEQQAHEFAYKNIITKAIGTESSIDPTVEVLPIAAGDLFLLCSDGLTDHVEAEEIEKILTRNRSIQQAANELIAIANTKGGHDNTTVVIVKVSKSNETKDLS